MLGKRSRPVTGKLPDPATSVEKTRFLETLTGPKSPLDIKIRSPRGLKTCNLGGGVGLGIVAALDKSRGSGSGSEAPAPVNIIVCNLNLIRSDPIPIGLLADKSKTTTTNKCCRDGGEVAVEQPGEMMGCNWDEFTTCVTSHGPNNKSFTRLLYFDGGEDDGLVVKHKPDFGAVCPSPPPPKPVIQPFPTSNFLSSCYLCRKHLHGKDIYMYRGEKAFCSAECRYRQIVSDERKEKCRSEASRSVDISVSPPYSGGHLFSTGIFAA